MFYLLQVLTIEDLRRTFLAIYPCFIAMTTFFHNETGGGLAWRTTLRACRPFISEGLIYKTFSTNLFHHGWRKFFISMFWNARWWKIFNAFYTKWLKKISNVHVLRPTRMKDFHEILIEFFHHGWRKFWILMVWNAGEWRIFNALCAHKWKFPLITHAVRFT